MAEVNATISEPPTSTLVTLQGYHGNKYVTFFVKRSSVTTASGWLATVTADIKAPTVMFEDVRSLGVGAPVEICWTGKYLMTGINFVHPPN